MQCLFVRKRQLSEALKSLRMAANLCIEPRESKMGVLIDTASTLLSLGKKDFIMVIIQLSHPIKSCDR